MAPSAATGASASDLFAAYDQSAQQASLGAEQRNVDVCLEVAPGRATTVNLEQASGVAALDHLVLDGFARAVAARPVPAEVRPQRACYRLQLRAFRMPPIPVVSCGIGPAGFTCIWPFKKVSSVTAQLLSVEYPPKPGEPANHSLLRSAR